MTLSLGVIIVERSQFTNLCTNSKELSNISIGIGGRSSNEFTTNACNVSRIIKMGAAETMSEKKGSYYVDPKSLTPLQIHAIQILSAYGKPAPVTSGIVHCGRGYFRLKTATELVKLGIMYETTTELGDSFALSKVGCAIAPRVERWRVDY
jgi:hypothetical protein